MSAAKGSKSTLVYQPHDGDAGGYAFGILFSNESLQENIETFKSDDIRSDRTVSAIRGGNIAAGGGITSDFGILRWLYWIDQFLASGKCTLDGGSGFATAAATTYAQNGAHVRGQVIRSSTTKHAVCKRGGTCTATVAEWEAAWALVDKGADFTVGGVTYQSMGAQAGGTYHELDLTAGVDFGLHHLRLEKTIKGGTDPLYVYFRGGRLNTFGMNIIQKGIVKVNWGYLAIDSDPDSTYPHLGEDKASKIFTFAGQPADADYVTIDGKVYTFQTVLTNVDGHVLIGANAAATILNLRNAILLGTGAGTTYALSTTAMPRVTVISYDATTITVQARYEGEQGNSIPVSENATNVTISGGAFFTGGTNSAAVYPEDDPVSGYDAFISLDNGQTVRPIREAEFNMTNGIDEDVFCVGERVRRELPEGERMASGRVTTYFEDDDEYQLFKNETVTNVKISFIHEGCYFEIEFPETKLTGSGTPQVGGQGIVTASYDMSMFRNESDYDVKVTVKVPTDTYVASDDFLNVLFLAP